MATTSHSSESSMYILFATFLSGLIVTDFIKEASLLAHKEHPPYFIILLGAIWAFFVVFDTLIWQVYKKDNPSSLSQYRNEEQIYGIVLFVTLLRRAIEFGTLIWVYDIVNIIHAINDVIPKHEGISLKEELSFLVRFSLDIALMCSGWFFRRLLVPIAEELQTDDEWKDWRINIIRLFLFGIIFFAISYLIYSIDMLKANLFASYLLLYIFAFVHIIINFYCGKSYYDKVISDYL